MPATIPRPWLDDPDVVGDILTIAHVPAFFAEMFPQVRPPAAITINHWRTRGIGPDSRRLPMVRIGHSYLTSKVALRDFLFDNLAFFKFSRPGGGRIKDNRELLSSPVFDSRHPASSPSYAPLAQVEAGTRPVPQPQQPPPRQPPWQSQPQPQPPWQSQPQPQPQQPPTVNN